MKGQIKVVYISLAVLLVLVLVVIVVVRMTPSVTTQSKIQAVMVREVEKINKEKLLELTGSVDAGQTAVISLKIDGKVLELKADNGERVAAGQTLVKLEDTNYVHALADRQATLDKAKSNLATIQANYQRSQKLFESGAIAQSALDDVNNGLKAAQADEASAAAALAIAREALNNTLVTTPISGLVANRSVKLGQMLEAGTPVMVVEDISTVNVLVQVQQKDLNLLKLGLNSEVTVDTYPDKKFVGTVTVINPVADPSARVFETEVKVENAEGLLKPGMFVRVAIKYGASEEVMAVPVEALSSKQGIYYVFIPEGEKVKAQRVEIGAVLGSMVEIKSGLSAGQQIVVSNVNKLKDQDRITLSGMQEE